MSLTAFEGWHNGRGCGRVGPFIARAVHSPGRLHAVVVALGAALSDEFLSGLLSGAPSADAARSNAASCRTVSGWRSARRPTMASAVSCGSAASQLSIGATCGSSLDGMRTRFL